ncbi:hypothetical protein TTHERM_00295930 (macronuclear) [Tetrahymena thermophila SB210]|uniref:Uncharacterized protein n=1 Tax=Tetrahymena thermophila (strain SB210) TaxID=312017 RepID=I7MDZ0_TETTS|nr:hypothetical protein TTHERM_00295930 [Tetrahymena thermophila SB210]EAR92980.2 hypothetical protein TTHERM_00295930 [Tetrahymena thermophila SB210]|eukprot:XP_001013225.2 hypothetical protein TTHERM_00295930 [Tetrahymena thermophila SB210]
MDRLLEYYLFNPSEQLRLELNKAEGKIEKQSSFSNQQNIDARQLTNNNSQKKLYSTDYETNQLIKINDKLKRISKQHDNQFTQEQLSYQQKKQLDAHDNRNIQITTDYKSGYPKSQSLSYSQTLRNYKWLTTLPSNSKTPSNLNIDQVTPSHQGQFNYNTPINSKKESISNAAKLSNSAIFSQQNIPITPHQRVMRIKNRQINMLVQKQYNNLLQDSQNNFFDMNLEEYYRQMKNNQAQNDNVTEKEENNLEQNTTTKMMYADQKNRVEQNDHINIYLNQKTPESIQTYVQTPIDDLMTDSPKMRDNEKQNINPDIKYNSNINQNINFTESDANLNTENTQTQNRLNPIQSNSQVIKYKQFQRNSIKSSGIQNNISIRHSKRSSCTHGRVVSPILYNTDNIEKSPIQSSGWGKTFQKHNSFLHKQVKHNLKKEKYQNDFEQQLRKELSQIPNLEKLDLANFNHDNLQIITKDDFNISTTPQSLTYSVHKQKENYKPLQISKAFREQYKNIQQLLSFEQEQIQTPQTSYIPQRNKSQMSQKSMGDNINSALSNKSSNKLIQKKQIQMAQTFYSKSSSQDVNSDIKQQTFYSNFPIQKQNNEFRFSKQNIKRKNPSPKKNIFKI